MARLDTVPDPPQPRQRKGKSKSKKPTKPNPDDPTPFIRPSEITGNKPQGKPLVDLSLEDLRAAGVTFTEDGLPAGLESVAGISKLAGMSSSGSGSGSGSGKIPRVVVDPSHNDSDSDLVDDDGEVEGEEAEDNALEAWWDEFFDSMLYTIPFSFLFLLLDMWVVVGRVRCRLTAAW